MRSILWIRFKRLRQKWGLYSAMLIMPLLFTFFFGGMSGLPLLVVTNLDEGEQGSEFVASLQELKQYEAKVTPLEELNRRVQQGETAVGVLIPADFSQSLAAGKGKLHLVKMNDTSSTAAVEGVIRSSLQDWMWQKQMATTVVTVLQSELNLPTPQASLEVEIHSLLQDRLQNSPPIAVESKILDEKQAFRYDPVIQGITGFTLFFSMFVIIFTIGELVEDKQFGIWKRLQISPVGRWQVYLAQLIHTFYVGSIYIVLLILLGNWLFQIDWGNQPLPLFSLVIAFVFSISALGVFLSSMVHNMQQLSSITPIVAVSFAMLGGAYWPLEIVTSKALLTIAKLDPVYHAMSGMKGIILYDWTWSQVLPKVGSLLGIGVILMVVGFFMMERRRVN